VLFPLGSILEAWNPDVTLPPPTYGAFTSLRVFNFSESAELQQAEAFRRAEVPFVIRGIPSLDATVAAWGQDSYLASMMGPGKSYPTEVSTGQHFMFYDKKMAERDQSYVPPTQGGDLTVEDWLGRAHAALLKNRGEERRQLPQHWGAAQQAAEAAAPAPALALRGGASAADSSVQQQQQQQMLAEEVGAVGRALARASRPAALALPVEAYAWAPLSRAAYEMHYLRASTSPADASVNPWVRQHLAFLRSEQSAAGYGTSSAPVTDAAAAALQWPFFHVDVSQQSGIHCLFGMSGTIAEAHSDAGRNFIAMERGHKRYVLAPPSECSRLSILPQGPSARHSDLDWSSPEGIAELKASGGLATEVVISAGDALYVPAGWFHCIVSLDTTVQCNSRSGTPPLKLEELRECGIAPLATEALGEFTAQDAAEQAPSRFRDMQPLWRPLWPLAAGGPAAPAAEPALAQAPAAAEPVPERGVPGQMLVLPPAPAERHAVAAAAPAAPAAPAAAAAPEVEAASGHALPQAQEPPQAVQKPAKPLEMLPQEQPQPEAPSSSMIAVAAGEGSSSSSSPARAEEREREAPWSTTQLLIIWSTVILGAGALLCASSTGRWGSGGSAKGDSGGAGPSGPASGNSERSKGGGFRRRVANAAERALAPFARISGSSWRKESV
jgi:hypothetical protein